MLGGSRNLKPAGAGEEGAMARAAPGTSRGARAPGPLRGSLAFATKISTCQKITIQRLSPVSE